MNESRHNKYIKTKSVKVPSDLKLKTAISRFVFQTFPVKTELKKADRTVGVNCNIFSNISSGTGLTSSGNVYN